jgi:hypothetical protein
MKKTVYVFVFFVLIGVLSLACLSPTISSPPAPTPVPPTPTESQPPASVDTPTPLPTSTPADTPTPLPTSTPADTPTPEAQAFFTEEFNSSADLWSYFIIDGYQEKNRLVEEDEPKVSVGTNNGYLVFEINKNYQYVYVTYDPYTYTDVRIDVRAENFGVNKNNVSLICRYSDQGWYEFNIANNGLYSILLRGVETFQTGFLPSDCEWRLEQDPDGEGCKRVHGNLQGAHAAAFHQRL